VHLAGVPFTLKRQARGVYRTTLANDLLSVSFDNCICSELSPPVYVQMQSELLLSCGLVVAHQQTLGLVNILLGDLIEGEKVSRVDLFADFEMERGFTKDDLDRFVTRAKSKALHKEGSAVTSFQFGKGALTARIYDKAREVRKSGKGYLFDIWQRGGSAQVWRAEVQARRRLLKEFDVETVSDVVSSSQPIWDYWSRQWLSMRAETTGNVTRRRLTPFWERVQAVKLPQEENVPQIEPVWFCRTEYTDAQIIAQIKTALKKSGRYSGDGSIQPVLEALLPRLMSKL
jgi:hypothetical protein